MTRGYQERQYNMQAREFEKVADWTFAVYPGDNEHLTVSRNGVVKTVRVEDCSEFVYSLKCTKVLARGGASGLFEFIDKELYNDEFTCFAWKVLRHCFFDCKAA